MKDYQAIIESPIGKLGILASDEYLYRIDFLPKEISIISPSTFAAEITCQQLTAYFHNPRWIFELPCELSVTPFQRRVLDEIYLIPVGETRSYSEIAKKSRTGPRAVGMVCRCNPIPIIIPCHRVTAKNQIGGYGGVTEGQPISMKQWLLDHEQL
jgi:methylated-DNA-[protein]-cysteine S-methyltransferase